MSQPAFLSNWMSISSVVSAAGSIMDMHEHLFPRLPPLQPVIAGVAGNLVATQSSRISTFLHAHTEFDASQVSHLESRFVVSVKDMPRVLGRSLGRPDIDQGD